MLAPEALYVPLTVAATLLVINGVLKQGHLYKLGRRPSPQRLLIVFDHDGASRYPHFVGAIGFFVGNVAVMIWFSKHDAAIEFLQHKLHRVADQINAVTGTERVPTRTRQTETGPSVTSPSVRTWRYTPRITPMAPSCGGSRRLPQTPTARRDAYAERPWRRPQPLVLTAEC
jgi:hypothetical protein